MGKVKATDINIRHLLRARTRVCACVRAFMYNICMYIYIHAHAHVRKHTHAHKHNTLVGSNYSKVRLFVYLRLKFLHKYL
jgi:hypothetical protein